MQTTDLDQLALIAREAAAAAGAAIRPHFRAQITADLKSDDSPVTIADRGAEAAIRAVLGARTQAIPILGEEEGGVPDASGLQWVVDPIDGTRAFITGRPLFGTLVALMDHGVPVLGLIHQPVLDETWVGLAGRATVFESPLAGGGTARARACPTLAGAELGSTSPAVYDRLDLAGFQRLSAATKRTSWGGDCYIYGLLALGMLDIVTDATMQPWDWAALVPVVEGAGGRLTDWQGQPLRFGTNGRTLAVGDARLLAPAIAVLAS